MTAATHNDTGDTSATFANNHPRADLAITDAAVASAIRTRRRGAAMKLDELSEASGIERSILSRIERGERACRFTEMSRIAPALRTTSEDMARLARALLINGAVEAPEPGRRAQPANLALISPSIGSAHRTAVTDTSPMDGTEPPTDTGAAEDDATDSAAQQQPPAPEALDDAGTAEVGDSDAQGGDR